MDEAIKREIAEEIVIEIDEPILIGSYRGRERRSDIIFLFCCFGRGEGSAVSFSEIEECQFFSPSNLPQNIAPGVQDRISEAVKKAGEGILNSPGIIWKEW